MPGPSRRKDARGSSPRGARGLNLVEVLVCLAVLVLLATILMPSLGRARDSARSACCQSNLRQLWEMLHAPGFSGPGTLPSPESWTEAVAEQHGGRVMQCPEFPGRSARALLKDVWIKQQHGHTTYRYPMPDLLAGRCEDTDPVEFFQVHLVRIDSSTLEVHIGGSRDNFDGGVRVLLGDDTVTFICLDSPNAAACDSTHAVFFGTREVLKLEGADIPDQSDKAEPWVLTASVTSYGMNAAVPRYAARPGQLLLLDCDDAIADPAPDAAAPVSETLAPRHLGRVNGVLLDGSVHAYKPEALEAESPLWWP